MKKYSVIIKIKKMITDLAILLIIISGLGNIGLSLPHKYVILKAIELHYNLFSPETMAIHRAMSTAVGFILLFLSYRLYKRMRLAWLIAVSVLPISIILYILKFHNFSNIFTFSEFIILIILIMGYKDFNKESDPINLKWGIIVALVSVFLIILNTAIGLLFLRNHYNNIHSFRDCFIRSLQLLFYMDISVIEPKTRVASLFGRSAIILNWTSILAGLFLILKPLVYQPILTMFDKEKIRNYLLLYGGNPISYVAVENDKKYFFGNKVEGAIAYVTVSGVAVCAGDPICREEDYAVLLGQFITYCKQNDLDICFCQTTEKFLPCFRSMGFGIKKYGEEAMFDLQTYTISGGKAAKVRQAINNANREGIDVIEYKPLEGRNKELETKILDVSKEWLSFKKSGELSFMLGSVGLDNPMDRRYFVAVDRQQDIQGFVVFTPFNGKNGYYADVTRRRKSAPIGVMEKIVISAFEIMKSEGVAWGSLGLAPLANVKENEGIKTLVDGALEFIYEHMNNFYGFKTLHQYKKKYNPTCWEPRYLVYYPKVFTPKIAYAIIKAQNPKGVTDFLATQIKQVFQGIKDTNKK
ncbi:MAG: phosphatidylglycerol lysyltransferase domain-containing protein [Clostridia bacterium]|nr:phosphatidylglycerol lysyltransferase domain-containing protein [Clostridia bacterium]